MPTAVLSSLFIFHHYKKKCPQMTKIDQKSCVQTATLLRATWLERNDVNRPRFASSADNLMKGLQWLKSSTSKNYRD